MRACAFHGLLVLALFLALAPAARAGRCPHVDLEALFGPALRAASRVSKTLPPPAASSSPVAAGTSRTFWAWDFTVMPPRYRRVNATCRLAGPGHVLFVEDGEWGARVTAADGEGLSKLLEEATPATPETGALALEQATFGPVPDVLDGDPRLYVLLLAMAEFQGKGFDGYFSAFDQIPDTVAQEQFGQHSNEVEILYLNTRGAPVGSAYMHAVLVHELQHLLHWGQDGEEVSWVNESMSEAAMTLCGYDTDRAHLRHFAAHPELPLMAERVSYGACLLFGTYLLETEGAPFLRSLVACQETGVAGVEAALQTAGSGVPFDELFLRWAAANFAASAGGESPLGYGSFPVPAFKSRASLGGDALDDAFALPASASAYYGLTAPGVLRVRALPLEEDGGMPATPREEPPAGQLAGFGLLLEGPCGWQLRVVPLSDGGDAVGLAGPQVRAAVLVGRRACRLDVHWEPSR